MASAEVSCKVVQAVHRDPHRSGSRALSAAPWSAFRPLGAPFRLDLGRASNANGPAAVFTKRTCSLFHCLVHRPGVETRQPMPVLAVSLWRRCHAATPCRAHSQAHVRVNTRQPAWPGNLVRMFEPSIIMAPGNGAHSAPTTALHWPGLTLVPNLGMGNCTHVARVNRLSLPCGACRRRTWLRTDESRPAARLRSHRRRQKLWLH